MSACVLLALALAPAPDVECDIARPSTRVVYGLDDVRMFSSSSGTVRAYDANSSDELWTYAVPEGDPGEVRALRFDADGDGNIDAKAGDRLWIFFGTRGASRYYALDATDESPRLMWQLGPEELPGVGETWSAPTLVRVNVKGVEQNGERLVAIFGGGYAPEGDTRGRALFMVDAQTGRLLWSVDVSYAIASRVAAIDTDADGWADRLYVGDLGGQLWRFDITNGSAPDTQVTGRVIATLGATDPEAALPEDARKFFNAPDVAFVQPENGEAYYNVALGSGDRADSQTHDRFYSVRDRNLREPIRDRDLPALTAAGVPLSAPGWKVELRPRERVFAEALTAAGTVLVTTHQPGEGCGTNRVYAWSIESGEPTLDLNRDGQITPEDVSTALTGPSLGNEVRVVFNPPKPRQEGEPAAQPESQCLVGDEVLTACPQLKRITRTFWYRRGAD